MNTSPAAAQRRAPLRQARIGYEQPLALAHQAPHLSRRRDRCDAGGIWRPLSPLGAVMQTLFGLLARMSMSMRICAALTLVNGDVDLKAHAQDRSEPCSRSCAW